MRFERAFDGFFSRSGHRRTLWERLEGKGFSASELAALRELLDQLAASSPDGALNTLLGRGADLDRLLHLAGTSRVLEAMQSPLQAGFYTHRVLDRIGAREARDALGALRVRLVDALGDERATALASELASELAAASDDVRAFVKQSLDDRERDSARGRAARFCCRRRSARSTTVKSRRCAAPCAASSSGSAVASASGAGARGGAGSTHIER